MPLREALRLVGAGVPFDVALSIDDVTRAGWCIIISEQQGGGKFDFNSMSFKDS